jgi:hypothetical protein
MAVLVSSRLMGRVRRVSSQYSRARPAKMPMGSSYGLPLRT